MNPCPCSAERAPVVTWNVPKFYQGRDLIIVILDGRWFWRLDEPNARPSTGYPDYPSALAAACRHYGLPAIRKLSA